MRLNADLDARDVIRRRGGTAVIDLLEPYGWGKRFEVSVDTHTKGRRLDGYLRQPLDDGVAILVDPDLARLAVEIDLYGRGLRRRKLGVDVGGYDGAACPIELIR